MSDLSSYRAKVHRLLASDASDEAFLHEGYTKDTAEAIRAAKAFKASRSFKQTNNDNE